MLQPDLLGRGEGIDEEATRKMQNVVFEHDHARPQPKTDAELLEAHERSMKPIMQAQADKRRERAAEEQELAETVTAASTSDVEERLEKLLVEEEALEATGDSAALDRVRNEIHVLLNTPLGASGGR
jgi:hypothetical protein